MSDLQRIEAELEQERRMANPRIGRNEATQRRNAEETTRRKLDAEANRAVLAEADRGPEARKQAAAAKESLARFQADERSMAALLNPESPTHQVAQDTYNRLMAASVGDLPDDPMSADLIEGFRKHARKQRAYGRR